MSAHVGLACFLLAVLASLAQSLPLDMSASSRDRDVIESLTPNVVEGLIRLEQLKSTLVRLEKAEEAMLAERLMEESPGVWQEGSYISDRQPFNSEPNVAGMEPDDDIVMESPTKRRMVYRRNCDMTTLTADMIMEFLRTGRICGRRMSRLRYGLSGR